MGIAPNRAGTPLRLRGRIAVFGGTGYLGRRIADRLAAAGWRVRVAVRHPRADLFDARGDDIEQCEADVTEKDTVKSAVQDVDGIVNAVGLYVEGRHSRFADVHIEGARELARQAAGLNVPLVHVSGIGADIGSQSRYVAARGAGERAVYETAPDAVILRPSVLFGPGDAFLWTLVKLVRSMPVIPLFGRGATRLQPVHVEDVAEAVARVLDDTGINDTIFELGGPHIYRYRGLLEMVAAGLGLRRVYLPVPFWVWRTMAAVCAPLPGPPLTHDQVILMQDDNVVGDAVGTFRDLGIDPKPLEDTLAALL